MKSWPLAVAGLYALLLAALLLPLLAVAAGRWPDGQFLAELYGHPGLWLGLAVLGLCQLLLLVLPVRLAHGRPATRGSLWPTILLGAGAMGLLGFGAALSVLAAARGDNEQPWEPYLLALLVTGLWFFWTFAFRRLARERPPVDFVSRVCQRLIQGSVLELLVAVPCHIIVRQRNTCCAGLFTAMGLATGIAVMLFAFGPAVYFLFVARTRRLRAAMPPPEDNNEAPPPPCPRS